MQRRDLLTLARLGADARIAELQGEIDAIRRQFRLGGGSSGRGRGGAGNAVAGGTPAAGRSRNISAAGRQRIAAAARRRWAAWRKAKKQKK